MKTSTRQNKRKNNEENLLPGRLDKVFKLVAKGVNYTEIAEKLGISLATVQNDINKIKEMLRLKSTIEIVHYAVAKGVIKTRWS